MNVYSEEEMIVIFKSIFQMDCSKKDLQKCEPEFVQRIYTFFLRDFGASIEKMSEIPFDASPSMLQYPEMYRTTCFALYLAKCIKYYLNLIYNEDDFMIYDIFQPEWSRTKKFFSLFIDFYDHLCETLPLLEEVESEVAAKRKRFEKLKDSIESFKEEIKRRQMQNAENEICLEKEIKSVEAVKEEMETIQEMKARLKGRLEGVKAEIASLITKIKETELLILEGGEKIEMLKSQVVLQGEYQEIEESKLKFSMHKANNDQLKETAKELKHTLQAQKSAEDIVKDTLIPSLQEHEAELKKREEMISLKKDAEKMIVTIIEKDEEVSRSLQMLTESISLLQEERFQLQNSRELKKSGLEEINQLRLTLEELKRNNEQHEIVDKDLDSEHERVKEETETLQQKLKTFLDYVKSYLKNVTSEFTEFAHDDLEKFRTIKYIKNLYM